MFKKFTNGCVRVVNRWLPDAFLFAIILTLIVFVAAMCATGMGPVEVIAKWGDAKGGFWNLLAFSMQMALVLVFMANFGHPITRTFASRYANTYGSLRDGGFALVVRSRADKLSRSIGPNTLPYPLLCDAEGVLYDHLDIPQSSSALMTYSLEGWRILREAKRQGYQAAKGQMQQLPLTLILDKDGTVLFCHYGASLTDVPTDCEAMQSLLEELELVPDMPELEDLDYENFPELEDADELDEEFDTFH